MQCYIKEREKKKKKKEEATCSLPRKAQKKKKKRKEKKRERNWMNCSRVSAYRHFYPLSSLIFSLHISLHFEEKNFGGLRVKTLESHNLFSFVPIQPNILQKSFSSHFLSKVFHPPYFTSKQTHP